MTLFLPISTVLLQVFSCGTSGYMEVGAGRGTKCWTVDHVMMAIFAGITIPLFVFLCLRAVNVQGDIQKFCTPIYERLGASSSEDRKAMTAYMEAGSGLFSYFLFLNLFLFCSIFRA
jgi:hypothetical protein